MEPAHLKAVAHLPDAIEHRAMALVVGREAPFTAQIGDGREVGLGEPAERLRVRVPETRQRIGR